MTDIGKAYGFFECIYSKEAIEKEVPAIRELVNTPSELELSLFEQVAPLGVRIAYSSEPNLADIFLVILVIVFVHLHYKLAMGSLFWSSWLVNLIIF